jgi:hypothetical protein
MKQYTIQSLAIPGNEQKIHQSLYHKFFTWCNLQEENRFLWIGISIFGGIGTIVPITLLAIIFGANNDFMLWAITCSVNIPILIVNLSLQPLKIILPVLFGAWIINEAIIIYSIALFFS